MFRGNLEKRNRQGGVIGIDLDGRYAQVSFWLPGAQKPETLSQVMGQEDYMIPALLVRQKKKDKWLCGKEAQKAVQAGEAAAVDRLLSRALADERVEVEGEYYEGVVLLALYVKRLLSMLSGVISAERADMLMFTFEKIEKGTLQMVARLGILLSLPADKISCQSRAESFFYYNINQPKELWYHQCMICDLCGDHLRTLLLEANSHTKPVTVTVTEEEHPEVSFAAAASGFRGAEPEEAAALAARMLDRLFAEAVKKVCAGKIIDTVYLIGDGFAGDWYQSALQFLCMGRRVFQGFNLYSKGACYGAQAKGAVSGGDSRREYVYLGTDMLKVNVGLETEKGGEASCYPLLDAGMNWFDARTECDFLLNADHSFSLRLTPVYGKDVKEVIVTLDGVPERPERTTRIHLTVFCPDAATVNLRMEDKGFGELFPASKRVWEESFPLRKPVRTGREEE